MANILDSLKSKRSEIQEMQKQEERRRGRLEQLKKDLKEQFGVEDLDSVRKLCEEKTTLLEEQSRKLLSIETTLDDIISLAGNK